VPVYPVGYSFYYPTGAIRETKLTPFPEFIRLRRDLSACLSAEALAKADGGKENLYEHRRIKAIHKTAWLGYGFAEKVKQKKVLIVLDI